MYVHVSVHWSTKVWLLLPVSPLCVYRTEFQYPPCVYTMCVHHSGKTQHTQPTTYRPASAGVGGPPLRGGLLIPSFGPSQTTDSVADRRMTVDMPRSSLSEPQWT